MVSPRVESRGATARLGEEADVSALARNYVPLPVTLASGEGSWVTDVHGRRFQAQESSEEALS